MSEKAFWFCVIISKYVLKYDDAKNRIEKELRRIFGKDLVEYRLSEKIVDDGEFQTKYDDYVFIKAKKYSEHYADLIHSRIVKMALGTPGSPIPIPEKEISSHYEAVDESRKCHEGDLVKVKSGIFKNLGAIVHKRLPNGKWLLFFRFYTRCVFEAFSRDEFDVKANMSSQWKFPVVLKKNAIPLLLLSPKEKFHV